MAGLSSNHSWSWTIAATSGSGVSLFAMILLLFLVVKGGVSLNTATVGSSEDVLVFDRASNVGSVAVGGVVTSVIVESPSVDPSNVPPAVETAATVGVGTGLTDRMFNLQGRIVVPPQVIRCHHEGRCSVSCRVLDHLHMGNDALNPRCLAVRAITT